MSELRSLGINKTLILHVLNLKWEGKNLKVGLIFIICDAGILNKNVAEKKMVLN